MCVASIAAGVSHQCDLYSFICYPVYHYLERNVHLPEDKETNIPFIEYLLIGLNIPINTVPSLVFNMSFPLLNIYYFFLFPAFVTVFVLTKCCMFSMCS